MFLGKITAVAEPRGDRVVAKSELGCVDSDEACQDMPRGEAIGKTRWKMKRTLAEMLMATRT